MISITNIRARTTTVVRANVTGAPELPASYLSCDIQPDHVTVEFEFDPGHDHGWWFAQRVDVSGIRVLRPGPDGRQRLGKERHTATWYAGRQSGVRSDQDLPAWLDELVSELRPNGQVELQRVEFVAGSTS